MAETKKILLVEDDNNLREIYGARLQAEGYEIVSAPDGEQALAIAVKEKPDLIISDIMMPKVSGFDMLDILRNAPETRDTKVIMMTALSQAEDKARADKLGADMYLVKSQVTLEDVTKAVHQILDDPSDSTQEAESAAAQELVSGGNGQKTEEPAAPPAPSPEPPVEKPAEPPKEEPVKEAPAESAVSEPSHPDIAKIETPSPARPSVPEPVAPAPTPFEPVVAEAPADTPAQPDTSDSTSIPVTTPDSNDKVDVPPLSVEPSLAQALEDEEKAVQEKVNDSKAPTPDTSPPESTAPSSIIEPPEPQEPAEQEADSSVKSSAGNPLDEKPGKKVIAPINDLTKGPDINDLVAQEEAREAGESSLANNPAASSIIKPQVSDDTSDSKEDFGKISL